ncbi:TetR family transcriptional regulator [Streptomyces sp. NPDC048290]|uniref:TetR/AcrR family transcriptional regulator n=1 Tax=Streptomyces sp. NPDC048290 TaxID=3155811 RepID=UPI003433E64F
MPRITQEEKAHNREIILEAAGRLFRSRGVKAVGIAELMNDAGLTHGGFYNHFASKNELVAEVCAASFLTSLASLAQTVEEGDREGASPLQRIVTEYLSTRHRDAPDGGCPSSSLAADAARDNAAVQNAYAHGVEGYLTGFASELLREAHEKGAALEPREAHRRAIGLLSEMVGALILARAVGQADPDLSEEILYAAREDALR